MEEAVRAGAAAAITTTGISVYMYLLNVLVFAPTVSVYAVLYVIYQLHRFNLWSGLGDMVMGKLREIKDTNTAGILVYVDRCNEFE